MDTGGLLLAIIVTVAGIQDRDAAHRLLARLRERFTTIALVWANAGYAGRLLVWAGNILHLAVFPDAHSDGEFHPGTDAAAGRDGGRPVTARR